MYKRAAEGEAGGGGEPPAKKIVFQPLQLGAITNLEELDLKTLQFQNRQESSVADLGSGIRCLFDRGIRDR
jgi:molybdate-binding protein